MCSPDDFGGDGCCDTYPDSTNNDMSVSCEANVQGSNRMQRGLLYVQFIEQYWSSAGISNSTSTSTATATTAAVSNNSKNYVANAYIVDGLMHDKTYFFNSPEFQQWAYWD